MLSDWVGAGGNLIAMRPDKQLARAARAAADAGGDARERATCGSTPARAPGAGITGDTMQFHGTRRPLRARRRQRRSRRSTPTPRTRDREPGRDAAQRRPPAAARPRRSPTTSRARSSTRARATRRGRARSATAHAPIRSDDLFFGASRRRQPDWVDLGQGRDPAGRRAAAPAREPHHADEPRPRAAAALLVPPARREGGGRHDRATTTRNGGTERPVRPLHRPTARRAARSPTGSACARPPTSIRARRSRRGQAAAYQAEGFEIALHLKHGLRRDFTPASLDGRLGRRSSPTFAAQPGRASPRRVTNRTHCIVWSDWASEPKVELAHGIRLDTNYYYWPGELGAATGRAVHRLGLPDALRRPRRLADRRLPGDDPADRRVRHDVPAQHRGRAARRRARPRGLLRRRSPRTCTPTAAEHPGADAIVAEAQRRGVPVICARQLLDLARRAQRLVLRGTCAYAAASFDFTRPPRRRPRGLEAMMPASAPPGALEALTRDGQPVSHARARSRGSATRSSTPPPATTSRSYGHDVTPPDTAIAALTVAGNRATATLASNEPNTRFECPDRRRPLRSVREPGRLPRACERLARDRGARDRPGRQRRSHPGGARLHRGRRRSAGAARRRRRAAPRRRPRSTASRPGSRSPRGPRAPRGAAPSSCASPVRAERSAVASICGSCAGSDGWPSRR